MTKGTMVSSYYIGTAGNISAESIERYIQQQEQKGEDAIHPPVNTKGLLADSMINGG